MIIEDNFQFKEMKIKFQKFSETITNLYKMGSIIGTGKFSNVRKVYDLKNKKFLALKEVYKKSLKEEEFKLLQRESDIMKVLNHENIIKFHKVIETFDHYYYIIELVEGDDLFNYLERQPDHYIEEPLASTIMK